VKKGTLSLIKAKIVVKSPKDCDGKENGFEVISANGESMTLVGHTAQLTAEWIEFLTLASNSTPPLQADLGQGPSSPRGDNERRPTIESPNDARASVQSPQQSDASKPKRASYFEFKSPFSGSSKTVGSESPPVGTKATGSTTTDSPSNISISVSDRGSSGAGVGSSRGEASSLTPPSPSSPIPSTPLRAAFASSPRFSARKLPSVMISEAAAKSLSVNKPKQDAILSAIASLLGIPARGIAYEYFVQDSYDMFKAEGYPDDNAFGDVLLDSYLNQVLLHLAALIDADPTYKSRLLARWNCTDIIIRPAWIAEAQVMFEYYRSSITHEGAIEIVYRGFNTEVETLGNDFGRLVWYGPHELVIERCIYGDAATMASSISAGTTPKGKDVSSVFQVGWFKYKGWGISHVRVCDGTFGSSGQSSEPSGNSLAVYIRLPTGDLRTITFAHGEDINWEAIILASNRQVSI
jgi:hypothetical protein